MLVAISVFYFLQSHYLQNSLLGFLWHARLHFNGFPPVERIVVHCFEQENHAHPLSFAVQNCHLKLFGAGWATLYHLLSMIYPSREYNWFNLAWNSSLFRVQPHSDLLFSLFFFLFCSPTLWSAYNTPHARPHFMGAIEPSQVSFAR